MHEWMFILSGIFPIAEWETDLFEYTGATIKQENDTIELYQTAYVNSRLETVDIPKDAVAENMADQITKQDNMSTIGALSWLASQTRPDLQAGVSLAQRRQKEPTYQDVKNTNKLVKLAQVGKGEPLKFTKVAQDFDDLLLLVYHDAAWANASLDPDIDDYDDYLASGGQGVYSQLGHILLLTGRRALTGQETPTMVMGWKSHACPRVCRSTFAAEVMSSLEGWEDALCLRSFIAGALHGRPRGVSEAEARELFPVVSLTDCKSVYDNVHRVGGPKAPSEKRLVVDLTALRRMVSDEAEHWGSSLPHGKTLRWVHTGSQMADILTKVLTDIRTWWMSVRTIRLPF